MIETSTKKIKDKETSKVILPKEEIIKKVILGHYASYETVKKLKQQNPGAVFILPNGKEAKHEKK